MRRRLGSLVVLALLVTAACSDSSKPSAGPSSGSSGAEVCAWNVRADKETLNIAYPDTSATYWGLSYSLAVGERLELSGRLPAARYASFVTYGPVGGAVDSLTDRDIVREGDRYTITLERGTPRSDDGNRLAAEPAAPSSSSSDAASPVGRMLVGSGGEGAVIGSVLYRVYLPNDVSDPTGGAGLPDVRLVEGSGTSTPVPTCANPGPSQAALDIVNGFDRPVQAPPSTPIFIRPEQSTVNLYPNPDSVYVATTVAYQPDRIAVIRAKAPTYPDTRHGEAVTGNEQVRFWSMCTNEMRKPYPVTVCAADDETALDAGGFYTYVISTAADRPTSTPATAGSTWLDWGATDVPALLLLRYMLPNPTFAESATLVPPGDLAAPVMQEYAPKGAYCDKAVFEQGGPAACGL